MVAMGEAMMVMMAWCCSLMVVVMVVIVMMVVEMVVSVLVLVMVERVVVEVLVPEYGGVQDLLDPLTVQPCLPAAPDRGHVIRDLRHPVVVAPGLLLARGLAVVLHLQVLRGVRAGGGEHSGVNINLTERQPVTPETIPVRKITDNCRPSRVIWPILK